MENLETRLQADLVTAMKEHNESAVSALRSIKSAILVEKTNGALHELTDNDITKLIQKLSKQRQESIDIYTEAGRSELAEKEQAEKVVLDRYLPKMLSEEEIKTNIDSIITEVGATTMKDMGKVMKELSSRYPNQYDGKVASSYIKEKLS